MVSFNVYQVSVGKARSNASAHGTTFDLFVLNIVELEIVPVEDQILQFNKGGIGRFDPILWTEVVEGFLSIYNASSGWDSMYKLVMSSKWNQVAVPWCEIVVQEMVYKVKDALYHSSLMCYAIMVSRMHYAICR